MGVGGPENESDNVEPKIRPLSNLNWYLFADQLAPFLKLIIIAAV